MRRFPTGIVAVLLGIMALLWPSVVFGAESLNVYGPVITGSAVPTAVDLGALPEGNSTSPGDISVVAEIDWFTFTIDGAQSDDESELVLEIVSYAMEGRPGDFEDAETALYDSLGTLIASDDDDGTMPFMPKLRFGQAGGDGDLDAGTYYLAAGGYDTVFADGFAAANTGRYSYAGTYTLDITHATPEPTSMAILAVGLLAAIRRKR